MRKRLTGLLERSTKFLIDTNLFVATVKSGRTKSTELLVRLVEGTWDLVADDILIAEYERCALEFGARGFFDLIRRRVITIELRDDDILKCKLLKSTLQNAIELIQAQKKGESLFLKALSEASP